MKRYLEKLNKILEIKPGDKRDIRLGKLMTEMEREFNIPLLNDPIFNQEHEEVIKTYKMISDLRGTREKI